MLENTWRTETGVITEFQLLQAKRDIVHYARLIAVFQKSLPANRARLGELKQKLDSPKKTIFQKLRAYAPIIGLVIEKNKLEAWVNLYSNKLPIWTEELENAKRIVQKWDEEHSPDWNKFWSKRK